MSKSKKQKVARHLGLCGHMTDGWRNYCDDCYLRKEAGYGLWDLTHKSSKFLQKFAVERLINFTRHELEKYNVGKSETLR